MNKKICLAAVIGLAICILVGWFTFMSFTVKQQEDLAKSFLTQIYEVKDHDRYQSLQSKLNTIQASDDNLSSRQAAFVDYEQIFNPLTTAKCYEQLSENADYLLAEQFAAEHGYLFEVKNIALKSSYADKDKIQYDYTVIISAVLQKDATYTDITAEGILVLTKDDDGAFRVNNFKPFIHDVYARTLGT